MRAVHLDHFRRRLLQAGALSLALPLLPRPARAGAQIYEPLGDAVRLGLRMQIADAAPPRRVFDSPAAQHDFERWSTEMSARLRSRLPEERSRSDLLQILDYEATRAGIDRQMVLGLIQIESNFRKYAISTAGARGLMQVMPFWAGLIGDGDVRKLFQARTNLRYGCVILRHYIQAEEGRLFEALGRYNGSLGRPEYPQAVLQAWRRDWSWRE
jgi:soluble lytic murein transglycosylase-like protein